MVALLVGIQALMGCESGNKPTPKQEVKAASKLPTLYTGQQCFNRMSNLAQRWALDALPFHVESDLTSEATGQDGKSALWRGMFAAPSRRAMRTFICSGSRLPGAPSFGVTANTEIAYSPSMPPRMFQSFFLQTDSDKAFAIAQEHGGAALLKKDPKQPVLYALDWEPKRKTLLWTVVYGDSQAHAKGFGLIDATTGAFVGAGK
jgi:hypothetical protein